MPMAAAPPPPLRRGTPTDCESLRLRWGSLQAEGQQETWQGGSWQSGAVQHSWDTEETAQHPARTMATSASPRQVIVMSCSLLSKRSFRF